VLWGSVPLSGPGRSAGVWLPLPTAGPERGDDQACGAAGRGAGAMPPGQGTGLVAGLGWRKGSSGLRAAAGGLIREERAWRGWGGFRRTDGPWLVRALQRRNAA